MFEQDVQLGTCGLITLPQAEEVNSKQDGEFGMADDVMGFPKMELQQLRVTDRASREIGKSPVASL